MKTNKKSIFKTFLVFLLVAVLVFVGVKFIFPTPKKDASYNYTTTLLNQESYNNVLVANQEIDVLMQLYQNSNNFNEDVYAKFKFNYNLLQTLHSVNTVNQKNIAFANNSKTYNKNAKTMKKSLKNLNSLLEETNTYIDNQLNPFLSLPEKTVQSSNNYCFALANLTEKLVKEYKVFTDASIEIAKNLEPTSQVNPIYKSSLKTVKTWTDVIADKDYKTYQENSTLLKNFASKIETMSKAYYLTVSESEQNVYFMNLENLPQILSAVQTEFEDDFTSSVGETEKQNTLNAVAFFKGV